MKVAPVATRSPRRIINTSCDDVREAVSVCRPARRTEGARGVHGTGRHVLIGEPIDFLAGTGVRRISEHARRVAVGAGVASATEPIDDTSTGKLMEGVLAAFAQFDNDGRSDRTPAAM